MFSVISCNTTGAWGYWLQFRWCLILSWEGQSWECTEKPVVWRAAAHLLVTTYRELFCFFLITPSTGTSAGNLRRNHKRFHGHTGRPMLCDSSLSELGCTGRRKSGSFYCYCAWCSCSSERNQGWKYERVLSQTKKVHLYKALVISQIKNWIQMFMIVELVSIQVMFCPSFPQVSCDQGYWDHVTCGLPFVILCLEITVRQGQQRDAQLSSLPSANHFSLMIKTLISFFILGISIGMSPYWRLPIGNPWRVKASKAVAGSHLSNSEADEAIGQPC